MKGNEIVKSKEKRVEAKKKRKNFKTEGLAGDGSLLTDALSCNHAAKSSVFRHCLEFKVGVCETKCRSRCRPLKAQGA